MKKLSVAMVLALTGFLGCDGDVGDDEPAPTDTEDQTPGEAPVPPAEPEPGLVFSLTNSATGNGVILFHRGADGRLENLGTFPTGGTGTDAGLGSQSPIALSNDGKYLYVVNPGSNDISSFEIFDDHLSLISITGSNGIRPVSVTLRNNRLYVVNADDSSVAGFAVEDGWLVQIAGATRSLSRTDAPTAPAQIGLHPRGDVLIVTEKATNAITTFRVSLDGSLSEPTVTASSGMTPFGFDFTADDTLVVSEAFGGADNASAVSSYTVAANGTLSVISGSIPSGESAACWVVISGNTAYTTNTASNTVSAYQLDGTSTLTLSQRSEGVAAALGDGRRPIDMALAADEYLYVLNAGTDNILAFHIEADGSLMQIDDDLASASAVGLLAR